MSTFKKVRAILNKCPTSTFASIAIKVGVSRERVRQIAKIVGQTSKSRKACRKPTINKANFKRSVVKWLKEQNYDYCSLPGHEGGRVVDYTIIGFRCRECGKTQAKLWRSKNPERDKTPKSILNAHRAAWAKRNPLKCRVNKHIRRARKINAPGKFTASEFLALCNFYGNICLCCWRSAGLVKLTADHVIPLSKGGSNDISNIQPLCGSCNSSKGTKTVDYRVKSLDTLVERN